LVQVRRRSSRRQEILIEEALMARKISNTHEMRTKDFAPKVDRRKFLAGVAIAGAVAPQAASASVASDTAAARLPSALPPTARTIAAETSTPAAELNRIGGIAGSDFMVDVIKTLDIKYLPANCASSYRGIHESLNNYGGNKMPEFLTCTHEESAIGIAHGYFKVAGKPLLSLCHGTVGLSTPRWRSITPGATACRSSSWAATTSTPRIGRLACRRSIPRRTSTRWCATSPSGTTRRCPCSTSHNHSCAPTRFR
jgi:hypothetical protein